MTTFVMAISLIVALVAGIVLGAYAMAKVIGPRLRKEMAKAARSNPTATMAAYALVRQRISSETTIEDLDAWLYAEIHKWSAGVGDEVADEILD